MNQQQMYPYYCAENVVAPSAHVPFHQQLTPSNAEQSLQRPMSYQHSYYYTSQQYRPHPNPDATVLHHPMHTTYYNVNPQFWHHAVSPVQIPPSTAAENHNGAGLPYGSSTLSTDRYFIPLNGSIAAGSVPSTFKRTNSLPQEYYFTSLAKPCGNRMVMSKRFHVDVNSSPLILDIESVKSGLDQRTSLMIRNIPNKYKQQSLLSEFQRTGHGPDKIDFFYLPIDFKNKCNRGYAFVNFVDVEDIVSFYNTYHEQPWKVFNSEKICVVMYARIQGKEAFLKRFEHSEILGKDCEYHPLSFVSHGPNKGKPEELPKAITNNEKSCSNGATVSQCDIP